jgi:hypothetical protein
LFWLFFAAAATAAQLKFIYIIDTVIHKNNIKEKTKKNKKKMQEKSRVTAI